MSTFIFLGPSLSWAEAAAIIPSATVLPPAQAGDVYKAVEQGATTIAIVDGFFEQVPSIWHKEVLYALSRGVRVFGASSMGALRAAELSTFGMVGVGRIFEAYRDGTCEDDDEVTVLHGPKEDGFKPLSEAMVNVRFALERGLELGLISRSTHDTLLAEIKRHHYPERSWALLPQIAVKNVLPRAEIAAFTDYIKREKPNLKRADAIQLLTRLNVEASSRCDPFHADFHFQETVYWVQLVGAMRTAPSTVRSDIRIEALRNHVAVVEPEADSIFQGALLLYLVAKEAQRLGIRANPTEVAQTAERFRRSQGLLSAAATHAWLERNASGQVEFSALMEMLSLLEAVMQRHENGIDAFLPVELQRRGRFPVVAKAVAEKRRILNEHGLTFPSPEDAGTNSAELLRWYESNIRKLDAPFESHRKSRGLNDSGRFMRELLAEYLRHKHGTAERTHGGEQALT